MQLTTSGSIIQYKKSFLPAQAKFMKCAAPEILFSGSWGCGKTRVLCEKVLLLCIRYPGNRVGLFRRTAKACKATTLRKLLERDGDLPPVIPPQLILQHHKKDAVITLRTDPPSEILYGGMDQKGSDGEAWYNSIDFGAVAVDQAEEITEDDYSLLQGRLRHPTQPVQQTLLACNPKGKAHWLYKRFFMDRSTGGKVVVKSKTLDNIYLPKTYLSRLSKFTGPYYQRFILGEWVDTEGLVYENFDPLLHIIPPSPIPTDWTRFWAVDFGYAQPFCAGLWAVKGEYPEDWNKKKLPKDVPEGSMLLVKEIYYSKRLVSEHATRMFEIAPPHEVDEAVCDWDADGRATLEQEGYSAATAYKSIEDGLQVVMYRVGNYTDPTTGKYIVPTMYSYEDALDQYDNKLTVDPKTGKRKNVPTCTAEEFGFYQWPTDRDGNPKKTEVPEDRFNHGMDMTRYAVARIDGHYGYAWIG